MTGSFDVRAGILKAIPHLRAFAISLTGDVDRADDLVQEALVRGLGNLDKFQPGTSMQAWLFTILRNQFHTAYRKRRREVEDPDGQYAARLAVAPTQDAYVNLKDLGAALLQIPVEQREAVLLAAGGINYQEAAQICGVAIGTIKSRVNRARHALAERLSIADAEDIGADRIMKAAVPAT
ncbi:sigma-70 family RNA polymerase sigma factor [Microvirga ossetica]|uniref:sigma-70 family RNA polymerase sigma factor n=1 Tax=Microvirga ossetica TaxID=1882682 RepID=UPI00156F8BDC|nr:sigma-70 family RNA polymerase sigma factor [Microvirga ossetica]